MKRWAKFAAALKKSCLYAASVSGSCPRCWRRQQGFASAVLPHAPEQPERMRVALLRGRVDGEELHDPVRRPEAGHAETAATVGLEGEVTAVLAVAVEVDESSATRALACPVSVVVVDHCSSAARGLPCSVAFALKPFMCLNGRCRWVSMDCPFLIKCCGRRERASARLSLGGPRPRPVRQRRLCSGTLRGDGGVGAVCSS
jgi:hypothetical protein